MAKKVKQNDILDFNPPKIGVRRNSSNIKNLNPPSFYVSDISPIKDLLSDLKEAILNLEKGKCLVISNDNTGMTIVEIQKKVSNIVINHKVKFTDKNFKTSKIDDLTLAVLRTK